MTSKIQKIIFVLFLMFSSATLFFESSVLVAGEMEALDESIGSAMEGVGEGAAEGAAGGAERGATALEDAGLGSEGREALGDGETPEAQSKSAEEQAAKVKENFEERIKTAKEGLGPDENLTPEQVQEQLDGAIQDVARENPEAWSGAMDKAPEGTPLQKLKVELEAPKVEAPAEMKGPEEGAPEGEEVEDGEGAPEEEPEAGEGEETEEAEGADKEAEKKAAEEKAAEEKAAEDEAAAQKAVEEEADAAEQALEEAQPEKEGPLDKAKRKFKEWKEERAARTEAKAEASGAKEPEVKEKQTFEQRREAKIQRTANAKAGLETRVQDRSLTGDMEGASREATSFKAADGSGFGDVTVGEDGIPMGKDGNPLSDTDAAKYKDIKGKMSSAEDRITQRNASLDDQIDTFEKRRQQLTEKASSGSLTDSEQLELDNLPEKIDGLTELRNDPVFRGGEGEGRLTFDKDGNLTNKNVTGGDRPMTDNEIRDMQSEGAAKEAKARESLEEAKNTNIDGKWKSKVKGGCKWVGELLAQAVVFMVPGIIEQVMMAAAQKAALLKTIAGVKSFGGMKLQIPLPLLCQEEPTCTPFVYIAVPKDGTPSEQHLGSAGSSSKAIWGAVGGSTMFGVTNIDLFSLTDDDYYYGNYVWTFGEYGNWGRSYFGSPNFSGKAVHANTGYNFVDTGDPSDDTDPVFALRGKQQPGAGVKTIEDQIAPWVGRVGTDHANTYNYTTGDMSLSGMHAEYTGNDAIKKAFTVSTSKKPNTYYVTSAAEKTLDGGKTGYSCQIGTFPWNLRGIDLLGKNTVAKIYTATDSTGKDDYSDTPNYYGSENMWVYMTQDAGKNDSDKGGYYDVIHDHAPVDIQSDLYDYVVAADEGGDLIPALIPIPTGKKDVPLYLPNTEVFKYISLLDASVYNAKTGDFLGQDTSQYGAAYNKFFSTNPAYQGLAISGSATSSLKNQLGVVQKYLSKLRNEGPFLIGGHSISIDPTMIAAPAVPIYTWQENLPRVERMLSCEGLLGPKGWKCKAISGNSTVCNGALRNKDTSTVGNSVTFIDTQKNMSGQLSVVTKQVDGVKSVARIGNPFFAPSGSDIGHLFFEAPASASSSVFGWANLTYDGKSAKYTYIFRQLNSSDSAPIVAHISPASGANQGYQCLAGCMTYSLASGKKRFIIAPYGIAVKNGKITNVGVNGTTQVLDCTPGSGGKMTCSVSFAVDPATVTGTTSTISNPFVSKATALLERPNTVVYTPSVAATATAPAVAATCINYNYEFLSNTDGNDDYIIPLIYNNDSADPSFILTFLPNRNITHYASLVTSKIYDKNLLPATDTIQKNAFEYNQSLYLKQPSAGASTQQTIAWPLYSLFMPTNNNPYNYPKLYKDATMDPFFNSYNLSACTSKDRQTLNNKCYRYPNSAVSDVLLKVNPLALFYGDLPMKQKTSKGLAPVYPWFLLRNKFVNSTGGMESNQWEQKNERWLVAKRGADGSMTPTKYATQPFEYNTWQSKISNSYLQWEQSISIFNADMLAKDLGPFNFEPGSFYGVYINATGIKDILASAFVYVGPDFPNEFLVGSGSADGTSRLGDAFGPNTKYLVSLTNGNVYSQNYKQNDRSTGKSIGPVANIASTQAQLTQLVKNVETTQKTIIPLKLKAKITESQELSLIAIQNQQYPYHFYNFTLGLGVKQVVNNNYIYALIDFDTSANPVAKALNNYDPVITDYYVARSVSTKDSNGKPTAYNWGIPVNSQDTDSIVSLIDGKIYSRSGYVAFFSGEKVSGATVTLSNLPQTLISIVASRSGKAVDGALQNRIKALHATTAASEKQEIAEREQLEDQEENRFPPNLDLPLIDSTATLAYPYSDLKAYPLIVTKGPDKDSDGNPVVHKNPTANSKFYLYQPGDATTGVGTTYFDFNAGGKQKGKDFALGIFYVKEQDGTFNPHYASTGWSLISMRQRHGVRVKPDGTQSLGVPVPHPPFPMTSADKTMPFAGPATGDTAKHAMIVSSDAKFPRPGFMCPAGMIEYDPSVVTILANKMLLPGLRKGTSTYIQQFNTSITSSYKEMNFKYYYNEPLQAFVARMKGKTWAQGSDGKWTRVMAPDSNDLYIDMGSGFTASVDGSPRRQTVNIAQKLDANGNPLSLDSGFMVSRYDHDLETYSFEYKGSYSRYNHFVQSLYDTITLTNADGSTSQVPEYPRYKYSANSPLPTGVTENPIVYKMMAIKGSEEDEYDDTSSAYESGESSAGATDHDTLWYSLPSIEVHYYPRTLKGYKVYTLDLDTSEYSVLSGTYKITGGSNCSRLDYMSTKESAPQPEYNSADNNYAYIFSDNTFSNVSHLLWNGVLYKAPATYPTDTADDFTITMPTVGAYTKNGVAVPSVDITIKRNKTFLSSAPASSTSTTGLGGQGSLTSGGAVQVQSLAASADGADQEHTSGSPFVQINSTTSDGKSKVITYSPEYKTMTTEQMTFFLRSLWKVALGNTFAGGPRLIPSLEGRGGWKSGTPGIVVTGNKGAAIVSGGPVTGAWQLMIGAASNKEWGDTLKFKGVWYLPMAQQYVYGITSADAAFDYYGSLSGYYANLADGTLYDEHMHPTGYGLLASQLDMLLDNLRYCPTSIPSGLPGASAELVNTTPILSFRSPSSLSQLMAAQMTGESGEDAQTRSISGVGGSSGTMSTGGGVSQPSGGGTTTGGNDNMTDEQRQNATTSSSGVTTGNGGTDAAGKPRATVRK
ncbi:hypothetical protein HN446_05090 [bacterium]|jgi:hypothetical protein|nr:hypothetical protein [bacterium]